MRPATSRRQTIDANQQEYGLRYLGLPFPSPQRRRQAEQTRLELLARCADRLDWAAGATKPHLGELAPGCARCVAGSWSCLFINASCNARCFYCPTPQDRREPPATNNLTFRLPADYATYLQRLGFDAASLSGGEPLLTPRRTLAFLRAARQALGPAGHLWLYTNGILLTREMARQLRDAGLDEIRFDIGATGYRLDRIGLAAGIIPTVTVEIPAVPEECERLKRLLPELRAAGVDHLNLHQLRLTAHNYPQLTERGYTFLHGEKITVLESELAALDILAHAAVQRIGLPINYCSFVFKHRHQQAAARRRAALLDRQPGESLTAAGYLRRLALTGPPARLARQAQRLRECAADPASWHDRPAAARLDFAPDLWPLLEPAGCRLAVGYAEASISSVRPGSGAGWALPLGELSQGWVQRKPVGGEFLLGPARSARFAATWLAGAGGPAPASDPFAAWEICPPGLQAYF